MSAGRTPGGIVTAGMKKWPAGQKGIFGLSVIVAYPNGTGTCGGHLVELRFRSYGLLSTTWSAYERYTLRL